MTGAARSYGAEVRDARIEDLLRHVPVIGRRRDYRRYLIIARARSGSTLLARRLASHPQVSGFDEILVPGSTRWVGMRWWQPARGLTGRWRTARMDRLEALRARDPLAFAEAMAWGPRRAGIRAAGFKMLAEQVRALGPASRDALLTTPGLHVILLDREDQLGRYVSAKAVARSGIYHVEAGGERPHSEPITVDPEDFARFVRESAVSRTVLRRLTAGLPCLDLTYEDLVARREATNARLCDFLGLDPLPLTDRLEKLAVDGTSRAIANLAQLRRALAGTPLEQYLDLAGAGGS